MSNFYERVSDERAVLRKYLEDLEAARRRLSNLGTSAQNSEELDFAWLNRAIAYLDTGLFSLRMAVNTLDSLKPLK